MQVRYIDTAPESYETELLACGVVQATEALSGALAALDDKLGGAIGRALAAGDMRGRKADQLMLYGNGPESGPGPRRVLLLGIGKAEALSAEVVRRTTCQSLGQLR